MESSVSSGKLTKESRQLVSMKFSQSTNTIESYLVTVTPLVVLGADVLVSILGALLQSRHVAPVLPVIVPQVVGVGAGGNDARGDTTVNG